MSKTSKPSNSSKGSRSDAPASPPEKAQAVYCKKTVKGLARQGAVLCLTPSELSGHASSFRPATPTEIAVSGVVIPKA